MKTWVPLHTQVSNVFLDYIFAVDPYRDDHNNSDTELGQIPIPFEYLSTHL